jgi:hypothetical protein
MIEKLKKTIILKDIFQILNIFSKFSEDIYCKTGQNVL